jgi:hypothetical protein
MRALADQKVVSLWKHCFQIFSKKTAFEQRGVSLFLTGPSTDAHRVRVRLTPLVRCHVALFISLN